MGMFGLPGFFRNELWPRSACKGIYRNKTGNRGCTVPEDSGRHVTTTTDGDHKVGLDVLKDALSRSLAQLVHLSITCLSVFFSFSLFFLGRLSAWRALSAAPNEDVHCHDIAFQCTPRPFCIAGYPSADSTYIIVRDIDLLNHPARLSLDIHGFSDEVHANVFICQGEKKCV